MPIQKIGHEVCTNFTKYYNACKCCVLGDSIQYEGNCVEKSYISNIEMNLICEISVLFEKMEFSFQFHKCITYNIK